MRKKNTRRQFIRNTSVASVGFWATGFAPAAESKSPNEKLNIGVIGAGGKGHSDTKNVSSENIVALCDVDDKNAAGCFKQFPKATKYKDFRKMLDKENLDAVTVSTPDHTHAIASLTAMRMGKHIFCQKPLTHDVYEARLMRDTARKYKVASQMGNQGTSHDGLRRGVEYIRAGAIGPVREVHVWTNRPIWPQGIGRPKEAMPVPATLDWDLWLGTAPKRPYHEAYCPFRWRGWWDFGTGALGDMACHTANMPFMALKLGYPTSVEAKSDKINPETYPNWSTITYQFPKRGDMPPVKWVWYDGKIKGKPNVPDKDILGGITVRGSGCLLVGDEGILYSPNDYGDTFKLLPEEKFKEYIGPEPTLPRSPGHHKEWIRACKGGPKAMSNFDYAALLTETVVLGNVATRAQEKIEWDGPNMRVTNVKSANKYIRREYRKGWEL